MRQILERAIQFIRENPRIIYSLVLVVILPAAFFINTYLINSSYEKNIDRITQRKAVLVEDVINSLIRQGKLTDGEMQAVIEGLISENPEIRSITVSRPGDEPGEFETFASSNRELIGQQQADSVQDVIAWNQPEGIAFLDADEGGRFWRVTKALRDADGNRKALIAMALSLNDTDELVRKTVNDSYWILLVIVLIVVLLVANQGRLFGYALTLSKLKEVDKMKDMFISMASHELRTPLTAINGYADLLKDKKAVQSDKESSQYLANITTSVQRLQDLVNDVLEVSRVEGNRLPMTIVELDPSETILQSVEEMRHQAASKNLQLNYVPQVGPLKIRADKDRLKQVMVNLIGNAVKYTPSGSVDVSVKTKGSELQVTVADTGLGMSAEAQANLFQKFYRIQTDKTRGITGTGLGLWITQEIVKRMEGKITVESIEGVGSHFTVHLPLA